MATTTALRPFLSLALCAALLALPVPGRAQGTAAPGLLRETLGEGIYLFRAPSALDLWTATNVVVVINEKDVTVFDSFTRAGTARMVIAEIRKLTSKPVRTLINSHWHQDHWSGNQEFVKAYPGVQIIATRGSRDYMKRMGPGFFAASIERGATAARAALDSAVRTGKQADGAALTAAVREQMEHDVAETEAFGREVRALHRVLPTLAFQDTLVFWSGSREFRLFEATGDATSSTVLYLPGEQLLVTGDVLVAQESGEGPPPWTTNSYSITPWLTSLRSLEALELRTIVPGQGIPFHDKRYLHLTIRVFEGIIAQVHAALERGVVGLEAVQAAVDVDSLGRQYSPDGALPASFRGWVSRVTAKVNQESLDGVAR
jgi:cyclase